MDKAHLINHLRSHLLERVAAANEAIASAREAFGSETKSSAGDKHEVGRAMVQQELDKLEEQRTKLKGLQLDLERVPMERKYDRVAFGSLVSTDNGLYFVAIGIGAVEVDGTRCYAISMASPIGQVLAGKTVRESVSFNGKVLVIEAIE